MLFNLQEFRRSEGLWSPLDPSLNNNKKKNKNKNTLIPCKMLPSLASKFGGGGASNPPHLPRPQFQTPIDANNW